MRNVADFEAVKVEGLKMLDGSRRFLVALLVAVSACGDREPRPKLWPRPPPGQGPDIVVRPTSTGTINLSLGTTTLPNALIDDPTLSWAALEDGRLLMGGQSGLFEIQTSTVVQISSVPVYDVAIVDRFGLVVSNEDGLFLYDGILVRSQLDETLAEERVRAFMPRGDEMWLASDKALYRLDDETLYTFNAMSNIVSLSSFDGGNIVVESSTDGFSVLRVQDSQWDIQSMSEEFTLSELIPGFSDRLVGIDQSTGHLVERLVRDRDGATVWRRIALTTNPQDPGAKNIETITVDPTTGFPWIIQSNTLSRIESGRISQMTRPLELGSIIKAKVSKDGALWLSDGMYLLRVGSDGPPISFDKQIKPFSDQNCRRCHAPMVGVSTTILDSYGDWINNIDKIIFQIESKRMPADQRPLVGGSIDLPRQWRDGGLRP